MSNFENLNDWELIARKGDRNRAFEVLFKRHRNYVFRLALGFTGKGWIADDVLQEVFIRLYGKDFKNDQRAEFSTYLYRFTLNISREELRRSHSQEDKDLLVVADENKDSEHEAKIREMEHAIKGLSQKQREILTLRFFEDKSVEETAQVVGCKEGTVKSNLHWAIRNLRKMLK